MEVIKITGPVTTNLEPSVVALGFFDGMHLGHLALLEEVISQGEKSGLKTALMTFDVQPKTFLAKQREEYLTSVGDKIAFGKSLGLDYFIVLEFNDQLKNCSPLDFVETYLRPLNFKHVVCGFDYTFGKKGLGNSHTLEQFLHLFSLSVVAKKEYDHHKIASSQIRQLLKKGRIEQANNLLGRPYKVTGKVVYGKQLGKQIGFPTANIDYGNYLIPKRGVYAVNIIVAKKTYLAMANVGLNPTVETLDKLVLEVNIFDFATDIYDQHVEVEFLKYVREEIKFDSLDQLIDQLKADRKTIIKGETPWKM